MGDVDVVIDRRAGTVQIFTDAQLKVEHVAVNALTVHAKAA